MKADYYRYRPLRNQIKKYDTESVILQCIKKLHEISKKPVFEEKGYLPWEIMFLIKFMALDGNVGAGLKADANSLPKLLNKIKDNIGNSTKFIDKGGAHGLNKYMRRAAFQQFCYQSGSCKADFGRQMYLFRSLEWEYPVKEKFKEITGVRLMISLKYPLLSGLCWGKRESKHILIRTCLALFRKSMETKFLTII